MAVNFVFNWESNQFEMDGGTPVEVEGRKAAEAWADQMLHIKRGRLEIMPDKYGTSAQELIGKRLPYHYRLVELEREIAEAVSLCPEIKSVSNVRHDGENISFDMEVVSE